jgi:hypothetical protein
MPDIDDIWDDQEDMAQHPIPSPVIECGTCRKKAVLDSAGAGRVSLDNITGWLFDTNTRWQCSEECRAAAEYAIKYPDVHS